MEVIVAIGIVITIKPSDAKFKPVIDIRVRSRPIAVSRFPEIHIMLHVNTGVDRGVYSDRIRNQYDVAAKTPKGFVHNDAIRDPHYIQFREILGIRAMWSCQECSRIWEYVGALRDVKSF